ncbi:isochorismatase family cysteine hydrolase [Alkalibacillus salilacus]|uniref:Nicotinamidase-related amidase n=1 Tax=Alkalibacillus salilacus TaxID=284582 RepID=A0ABT9VFD7_9BACI|nr:isochorismatase family cysteine hydrolase [Alkalibacillus salilacus]MDQ0159575.1 nicotinamidase-related amidase [Alkalibacillus salilacus]
MANQALLIIDMINRMDFIGAENLYSHTVDIVEPIVELKQLAKQQGIPVIYVNDNFGMWKKSYDELVDYCSDGMGKGWIDRLRPTEDDYFIYKPKHSGFYGTQLNLMLKDLGIDHLILTGVAGDMCVLFTAKDAYIEGYSMWVPENAIASEEQVYNEAALHIIHRLTACDISAFNGKIHEA